MTSILETLTAAHLTNITGGAFVPSKLVQVMGPMSTWRPRPAPLPTYRQYQLGNHWGWYHR